MFFNKKYTVYNLCCAVWVSTEYFLFEKQDLIELSKVIGIWNIDCLTDQDKNLFFYPIKKM